MNKLVLATAALLTLSTAGAAEKIGGFLFGVQYERDLNLRDSMRFGVGLPVAGFFSGGGVLAVSGDGAYLRHMPRQDKIQPYYGGGLGLGAVFGKASGVSYTAFSLYPHVLGGVNFNIAPRWDLFAEASVGPSVVFGGASSGGTSSAGSSVTFGFGVRLGVNYQIR